MPTHQLLFGFTWWGLNGLFKDPVEGVPNVALAGYACIEADINTCLRTDFHELCARNNLRPIVQCFPLDISDIEVAIGAARNLDAILINAHAGTAHMDQQNSVEFINALYDKADDAGVKLLLETHRGRITQDLFRTSRLCSLIPRVRFNLDVSHYVLCEERHGPTSDMADLLSTILDRVEMIHGRVSNGQQIQVDIQNGAGELATQYTCFWAEAMRRWRNRSRPGTSLIFSPELGPPHYAITNSAGNEVSDRWQQSEVLRELAENAWKMSASAYGPLWPETIVK
jgi:sugar phosphate isomerase/epimerase